MISAKKMSTFAIQMEFQLIESNAINILVLIGSMEAGAIVILIVNDEDKLLVGIPLEVLLLIRNVI